MEDCVFHGWTDPLCARSHTDTHTGLTALFRPRVANMSASGRVLSCAASPTDRFLVSRELETSGKKWSSLV
jgi:hypothetical protein